MESSGTNTGLRFVLLGQLSLWAGLAFGVIGAFQFLWPGLFEWMPFFKSRPLHVSLVVAWIFSTAIGGIYHYLPRIGVPLYSERMATWHLGIFIATGLAIVGSYLAGRFGGREYWEFPPVLAIPIIVSWVMFGVNYAATVFKVKDWPVHYWMWATGILFFFITYLEANAWMVPYVRGNLVREITLQWKSYGALVGSWNMMVYGTSIFVMSQLSGNEDLPRSYTAFLLYFLGFTNLLFGWAHHTYVLPAAPWVRGVAYAVSMTELLVLAHIIRNWRSSLGVMRRMVHHRALMFIAAAEAWIFINLTLALLLSVPAVNVYTHGTHITVAHAMGSTIGINTMILLASVYFMLCPKGGELGKRWTSIGFWLTNISLLTFFVCLVAAGIVKGRLTIAEQLSHQEIMVRITPFLIGFAVSGVGILTGLSLILWDSVGRTFTRLRSEQ